MAATSQRTARMDLRMTEEQREEIERAASVSGMNLTQWALTNLLSSARRDVAEATATRLSARAFETFKSALDEGMPAEAQELLKRKPVWE